MKQPRVWVVAGTRPEVIKMAPVARALRDAGECEPRIIFTGQHRELAEDMFAEYDLQPDHTIGARTPHSSLEELGGAILGSAAALLRLERPGLLLVQGDTATVLYAALAGYLNQIPVGHVEAGLRSGQLYSPFPEEGMRRMVGAIATLHFAPTRRAVDNLKREAVDPRHIFHVGNTAIDALQHVLDRNEQLGPTLASRLDQFSKGCVLVTMHRRESFGDGAIEALGAIAELCRSHPDVAWVYPVHPNPNIRTIAERELGGCQNVLLLNPLSHREIAVIMQKSRFVLSDSGGIQEEAPGLGKHVVVLREVTERQEGVEAGLATLVGTDRTRILEVCNRLLGSAEGSSGGLRPSPYGDGRAAVRIADICSQYLLKRPRLTQDLPLGEASQVLREKAHD